MSKKAIISDLHIGNLKDSPLYHTIHLDYARWLRDTLKGLNISDIIIAGDFFHNRSSISLLTLNVGHLFLDILKDFQVTITSGNHCSFYLDHSEVTSLSIFKTRKNVRIIDEEVTPIDDIVYCPWGTSLEQIPFNSKIVIGHWDVQSFEMSKGKLSTHGLKAAELMERCLIAFSGHYHKPQQRFYGERTFYYLGSPMQLNYGEAYNDNFIHILDTDTLEVEKIENIVSPRFYHIHNESQLGLVPGNFVSIDYVIGEVGEKWKSKVLAMNPLELRTNTIREKVQQIDSETDEIKEFKVVDIKETLGNWPMENLTNLSEDLKKKVAQKCQMMYDKVS